MQHGPGAVLGYSCLLTGAPEDWYTPRGKRRALLRLEAQTESWVLQIPRAFVDGAIKHNPFPTLALAARKVCIYGRMYLGVLGCLLTNPVITHNDRHWRRSRACSA